MRPRRKNAVGTAREFVKDPPDSWFALTRCARLNDMSSERVLVVEDDEHVREAVARALRFEGYDVHTAVDGNDALLRVDELAPDVIVLDVLDARHRRPRRVPHPARPRQSHADPDAHRSPRGVRPGGRPRRRRRRLPRQAVRARRALRATPRAPAAHQRHRRRRRVARSTTHARPAAPAGVARRSRARR